MVTCLQCCGFLGLPSDCLQLLEGALVMTMVLDERPFLVLIRLLGGLQQLVRVPQALLVGLAAARDGDMCILCVEATAAGTMPELSLRCGLQVIAAALLGDEGTSDWK